MFKEITHELAKLADPEQAAVLRGFFKTGPGQYGEGDVFRGIKVPVLRQISETICRLCPLPMPRICCMQAIMKTGCSGSFF